MGFQRPRVDLLREGLDAGVAAQRIVEGHSGAVLHPGQDAGSTLLVVLVVPVRKKTGQVGRGEGLEVAVVEGLDVSLPKFLEQHLLIQNQIATTHAQLLIRQLANGKL